MPNDDNLKPYQVSEKSDRWRIIDYTESIVLEFRDKSSAYLYADLLNKAYRAGYKAGFRDGKC